MVRRDEHTATPSLARDVRDHRLARDTLDLGGSRRLVESCETDDAVPNGAPPVDASRQSECVRGCTLGAEIVLAVHCRCAISEHDAVKHVHATGVCAFLPVVHELH